jgi:hypothetical protein
MKRAMLGNPHVMSPKGSDTVQYCTSLEVEALVDIPRYLGEFPAWLSCMPRA